MLIFQKGNKHGEKKESNNKNNINSRGSGYSINTFSL